MLLEYVFKIKHVYKDIMYISGDLTRTGREILRKIKIHDSRREREISTSQRRISVTCSRRRCMKMVGKQCKDGNE